MLVVRCVEVSESPSGFAELESELGPRPFALRVDIYMCHRSVSEQVAWRQEERHVQAVAVGLVFACW